MLGYAFRRLTYQSSGSSLSKLHAFGPAPKSLPQSPYLAVQSMHKILLCTMREPPEGSPEAPAVVTKHWNNFLTMPLLRALCSLFAAAEKDPQIDGIILRADRLGQVFSEGKESKSTFQEDRHTFCSGMDLKWLRDTNSSEFEEFWFLLQEIWIIMHIMTKPLIACIEGNAIGLGCALSLGCDVRVAQSEIGATSSETNQKDDNQMTTPQSKHEWKIGVNEVRYGFLTPPWVTSTLGYLIGHRRAEKLVLTGALITPSHAHSLGLVDLLVRHNTVNAAVAHMHQMLAVPPYGRMQAKSMLRRELLAPLATSTERIHDISHYTKLQNSRNFKNVLEQYLSHMDPAAHILPSERQPDSWNPVTEVSMGETVVDAGVDPNAADKAKAVEMSDYTMEDMAKARISNQFAAKFV